MQVFKSLRFLRLFSPKKPLPRHLKPLEEAPSTRGVMRLLFGAASLAKKQVKWWAQLHRERRAYVRDMTLMMMHGEGKYPEFAVKGAKFDDLMPIEQNIVDIYSRSAGISAAIANPGYFKFGPVAILQFLYATTLRRPIEALQFMSVLGLSAYLGSLVGQGFWNVFKGFTAAGLKEMQQITEDFATGKITKEEAIERLKALFGQLPELEQKVWTKTEEFIENNQNSERDERFHPRNDQAMTIWDLTTAQMKELMKEVDPELYTGMQKTFIEFAKTLSGMNSSQRMQVAKEAFDEFVRNWYSEMLNESENYLAEKEREKQLEWENFLLAHPNHTTYLEVGGRETIAVSAGIARPPSH